MQLLKLLSLVTFVTAHPSLLAQQDGSAPTADIAFTNVYSTPDLQIGIVLPADTTSAPKDIIGRIVRIRTH
jgi:hypothetical protein